MGRFIKISILICLFISIIGCGCNQEKEESFAPPPRQSGHVYFLCGWKNANKDYSDTLGELQYYISQKYSSIDFTTEQFVWRCGDEDTSYSTVQYWAEEDYTELINSINSLSSEERSNTILVGHSIGCQVIINTLAYYYDNNISIKTAYLWGAAVSNYDSRIEKAINATSEHVVSFIHPQDGALMAAAFVDGSQLGLGSLYSYPGLEEQLIANNQYESIIAAALDVISTSNRYRNNHNMENFLNAWETFCTQGGTGINAVVVPQSAPNIKSAVVDQEFWWNREDECREWKLQRNWYSNHYRILGPSDGSLLIRYAYGNKDVMEKAFERVKEQVVGICALPE